MKQLNHQKAKRPVRNTIFRILMCVLVLAFGFFGMTTLASLKKSPAVAKNEERTLRVEAIRVRPADAPVAITGYGEVQARKVVIISPEVSGTIVEIHPRLDATMVKQNKDALEPRILKALAKRDRYQWTSKGRPPQSMTGSGA